MSKKFLAAMIAAAVLMPVSSAVMAQNLAIVNGKAIPLSRVDALLQAQAKSGRPVTPEMQGQARDELIKREVFAQEAHNRGLDTSDDFKFQVEMSRQSLLIRELINDFQKKNPVSDAEVKAEYDRFVAANSAKEYRARHILVEKEDQAKDVIARLKKGAKFEDLAKKMSKDPGSGANGGDLDWANPSNYVKEFSAAMVALAKGKFTETPVKSEFGFHVIRLDDVREAQLPKLEEVKPQISQQLMQQKFSKFQEELLGKAKIE